MITNAKGIAIIKEFEGCKLESYQDQGGVWTIGYGETEDVREGMVIDQQEADTLLAGSLTITEKIVGHFLRTVTVNENQFSALISFAFNEGVGRLGNSHLLKFLLAGDVAAASGQFEEWDIEAGAHSPGLLRRRLAEKALFLDPEIA